MPAPNTESAGRPESPAPRLRLKNPDQAGRYASPWSLRERLGMLAWILASATLFRCTPKPLNPWRLLLLRLFGATIRGNPFVHPTCIIKIPWLLTLEDRAALAPRSEVYNLARVTLRPRCVVGQYAYLCAGTHDLADPRLPLVVGEIEVAEEAFIGAKAILLPGVRVAAGAVIGAGAVVTKDMPEWTVCAGNPCRPIKPRHMRPDSR